MIRHNDMNAIQASIGLPYASTGRHIESWRDMARAEIHLYDHEYGIHLGAIKEGDLRYAHMSEAVRIVREACREPTSLEILYYAQIGGPHARGVP